jgi:hypothetical protein
MFQLHNAALSSIYVQMLTIQPLYKLPSVHLRKHFFATVGILIQLLSAESGSSRPVFHIRRDLAAVIVLIGLSS